MELTTFQHPEIRDSNDNVIRAGAYGKNTVFCNKQNTGSFDYINNNLQVHDDLINLLLASSSEYTDISSINDTLTNVINLAGSKQDRLIAGDNITIDGNVISSVGGGDVTKEEFEDLKRSNDALWKLTQGIAWDFETSTDEAYAKAIPSGAKCFDLKMLGGKSEVIDGTLVNHKVTDVVVRGKNGEVVQTKQVPQAIRDIEGNGWSAGSVYNYIDLERKKFVKRVDRVDMGTLNWNYGASVDSASGIYTMRGSGISNLKIVSDTKVMANILCDKYVAITGDNAYKKVNGVGLLTNGTLSIYDENYNTSSSPSAFKSAMSGTYLYYEMAEPQEIDIELDNRFSAILCEGNGSITFEGSTDYKLPIANSEEFLVKLNEV